VGGFGWLSASEADLPADEDEVDAAGQFLVDLEDLADLADRPGTRGPRQLTG
jgi:hypothetical protein